MGGVAGGVSGYLRKVRAKVETGGVITPEVESALSNIQRMEESVDYGRKNGLRYEISLEDYDKALQGEYDSFHTAAKNSIKSLEIELNETTKGGETLKQFIQNRGGLDRAVMESEGFDPASFKFGGSKPLFRKTGGKKPGDIAEALNEMGFRGGNLSGNDVLDLVHGINRGVNDFIEPEITAKVDFLQRQIDDLSATDFNDHIEQVYKDIRKADVDADIDYLSSLEAERELVKRPQVTPEQYAQPERPKASQASVSQRESFILDKEGLADDFNADMQKFNEIDNPRIIQDDELVDAGDFMKSIDDELEGIDSVLTCAYG